MRVHSVVALTIAGVLLLPGTVSAAPPAVSINGVEVSGGSATVTGTASFEGLTDGHSVVGPEASHAKGAVTTTDAGHATGVQLTDATITPIAGGLRFSWHVTNLPEQVPPEVVRYIWDFQIGTRTYQLIAKRTHLLTASVIDDPIGFVQQAAAQKSFFSIRGACGPFQGVVPTIQGCYHLTFLEGSFDAAKKRISIDLPFETTDRIGRVVAPNFKPGAIITETAGVQASLQYGLLTVNAAHPNVAHTITGTSPYHVGPQVSLAVASPNAAPSEIESWTPATLTGTTFSGTVSGLSASKNKVFARACNGVECSYTSFKAL